VAMVAMEPMAVPYAAHADHAAPVTDVTSLECEGAGTATDMASAEATTTEAAAHATSTTAAAPTTTAAAPTTAMTASHQHQQTAACIQIGVTGIARLREGCRGRKSNRKSTDDTKREDAAFHDCTSRGHLHDKFICTAASNSGTSSIGDRSAAIGVFTEEHASVAQPLFSQAETAPHQKHQCPSSNRGADERLDCCARQVRANPQLEYAQTISAVFALLAFTTIMLSITAAEVDKVV